MPMDKSKYPDNWKLIADLIKARDEWKCQECGVEHDTYIVRDERHPEIWRYATDAEMEVRPQRITHVLMTVHHIGIEKPDGMPGSPDDKMDCRPDNLITLCQFCHLNADRDDHLKKAAETRIRKRRESQLAAGQGELF